MRPVVPLAVSLLALTAAAQLAPLGSATFSQTDWAATATPSAVILTSAASTASVTITATQVNEGDDSMGGRIFLAVPSSLGDVSGGPCLAGSIPGYVVAVCSIGTVDFGHPVSVTIPVTLTGAGSGVLIAGAAPQDTIGVSVLYSITDTDVSNNLVYIPITAEAPIVGGGGGPTPGGGSPGSEDTTSTPAPLLTLSLSHSPAAPEAGGAAVSVLTISNAGDAAATGVFATAVIANGVFGASPGSCSGGSYITCGFYDIPAGGSVTENIPLTVGDAAVTIGATASGAGIPPERQPSAADSIQLAEAGPVTIAATLAGPASLMVGQVGAYTLTVTNTGTGSATNLVVDVTSSAGSIADAGSCLAATPTHAICTVTLAAGASATRTLTATGSAVGTMALAATPKTGTAGSASTTITAATTDLSFATFSASNANPHLGDSVTITLAIANLGAVDVNDAYLDSSVPSGWALGDQSRGPCVLSGSSIHCSFGHVGAGQTLTQTMNMVADKLGTISATGTAGSSVPDPNAGNNAKTLSITVTAA